MRHTLMMMPLLLLLLRLLLDYDWEFPLNGKRHFERGLTDSHSVYQSVSL